jgi:hypothetical protein
MIKHGGYPPLVIACEDGFLTDHLDLSSLAVMIYRK